MVLAAFQHRLGKTKLIIGLTRSRPQGIRILVRQSATQTTCREQMYDASFGMGCDQKPVDNESAAGPASLWLPRILALAAFGLACYLASISLGGPATMG